MNQEKELKKLKTEFAEETGIISSSVTNAKLNNKMIEEAKRQMSEKY